MWPVKDLTEDVNSWIKLIHGAGYDDNVSVVRKVVVSVRVSSDAFCGDHDHCPSALHTRSKQVHEVCGGPWDVVGAGEETG